MPAEAVTVSDREAGQLDHDEPATVMAAELAALVEPIETRLGEALAKLDAMDAKFDASAEKIDAALRWVITTVDRIRTSGVTGLLRGVDRKAGT